MLQKIYADSPNYKEVREIANALRQGEVCIIPTQSGYAYCCDAMQTKSVERICKLKGIDPARKALSLLFADLSQVSSFCRLSDTAFRFIREHRGGYTFILPVSSSVPKVFKHRKEIGVRLSQHSIPKLLIEELGNPLMVSSLPLDEYDPEYLTDPELVDERYGSSVFSVIDGGIVELEASTIIDCTQEPFEIIRLGQGEIGIDEPALMPR